MRKQQQRTIFGITLSKRAWNNVLVYIILLLMVLLWFVLPQPDKPLQFGKDDSVPSASSEVIELMPDDGSLQSIVIDQQVVVRQNGEWRCQSPCALSAFASKQLADTWQNLRMVASDASPKQKLVDVMFQFQGNQQARVELYAEPELLLRLPQQNAVYRLQDVSIEQLLGR